MLIKEQKRLNQVIAACLVWIVVNIYFVPFVVQLCSYVQVASTTGSTNWMSKIITIIIITDRIVP